jgi:hypothetical protein
LVKPKSLLSKWKKKQTDNKNGFDSYYFNI